MARQVTLRVRMNAVFQQLRASQHDTELMIISCTKHGCLIKMGAGRMQQVGVIAYGMASHVPYIKQT